MSDISQTDKNFMVMSQLKEKDICFFDANSAPFRVYGVFYECGKFRRLPENVARTINEGVYSLHANTAGGRVRFKTNSRYVAINVKMPTVCRAPHFALTGTAGFDVYVRDGKERYFKTIVPPLDFSDGYEGIVYFDSSEMREITVNFPLYSEVGELNIGLCENSAVYEPSRYTIEQPIVYYGSSITQGGCASRPGNSYESIISRRLDADYINLGFSGSARGEIEIAKYISGLNMSVFVYDYDHNAPTVEHLNETHRKMFDIIREANPDLPIVLMSRPKYRLTDEERQRLEIIRKTYESAKICGDRNVYLIDGPELMATAGYEGTVDDSHPNDFGFVSMAKTLGDLLEKIILNRPTVS